MRISCLRKLCEGNTADASRSFVSACRVGFLVCLRAFAWKARYLGPDTIDPHLPSIISSSHPLDHICTRTPSVVVHKRQGCCAKKKKTPPNTPLRADRLVADEPAMGSQTKSDPLLDSYPEVLLVFVPEDAFGGHSNVRLHRHVRSDCVCGRWACVAGGKRGIIPLPPATKNL
jgi:hypothetical protein